MTTKSFKLAYLMIVISCADCLILQGQNPRPGGGSGGGGGAQGPTGPTGPTGPSGLSLPTAQPITSGVTTSVTVPYNTTLTDLSQAVPSCTNGSGVGNAAWTTATGNSTQMVISFSGTTTANFTGSCTAILSIGTAGPTGPTGPAGGGGISGLTTGTIPKAASSTTLNDSSIFQSGTNIFVNATAAVGEFLVGSSATSVPRGISSGQFNTGTDSARFSGYKARGTQASPTTVVTADLVTRWSGFPYDGSNYLEAASIVFGTSGTIAATRTPTYISFLTSTDATPSVLTEAMRIDNAQMATFAGRMTSLVNGALSAPGLNGTGTWIASGSATTTKPYWLIEPSGTTSTGWSTLGTGIGVNAASGFTGNLLDLQVAGTRVLRVWSDGTFSNLAINIIDINTSGGCITLLSASTGQGLCSASGLRVGSTRVVGFQSDNTFGGIDSAISRVSAGVLGVGTGAAASVAGTLLSQFVGVGLAAAPTAYSLDVSKGVGLTGTARFFDQTATTGSTLVTITPGAAQSAASTVLSLGGIIKFAGTNSTGATTALLSTNSPAVTGTAPYTWLTVVTSDGSTGYIPVWK